MQSIFTELLQVALGTREKLSRVPNACEWQEAYDEAERQTVVGVLLDGLEKLSQEQLPPIPIKLQWIGISQINEQTTLLHQERAKALTSRFRSVGFRTCVLKGLSSARRYPNPLRRECGDIDLWVIGNRKDVMMYMRSEYEVGHQMWHHVDVKIFEDIKTEIHFHPSWLYNPWHRRNLIKYFKESGNQLVVCEAGEKGYVTTPVEFDLIFQLTHIFHHLVEDGIGLRQIVDYYTIKEFSVEGLVFREKVLNTIKFIGLYRFLRAMMYVVRELCGMKEELLLCEPDEKGGKFLLNDMLASGNFGQERKGKALPRNSIARFTRMIQYYPSEGLWILPWKVEHWCWRSFYTLRSFS